MSLVEATQSCISNYAKFAGRAARSEYWYFVLAVGLASVAAEIVDYSIGHAILGTIVSLGTIVPSVAVASRRLHDTDRSGWWQLVAYISPIAAILVVFIARFAIGSDDSGLLLGISLLMIVVGLVPIIFLFVWLVTAGTVGPNHFGPAPL